MQRKLSWLIQGQRASGWKLMGIFTLTHEGKDRGEGGRCSLTGSCGVLDWKQALILPIAPGCSRFKWSRTKPTKMAQLPQRAGWQTCIGRKCACGGNPAPIWSPGLWLQAISSRLNWLAALHRSACFLQTKKLWHIYRLGSSVGLCR